MLYVYVNVEMHTVEENSQDELNKQREQFFSASDLNCIKMQRFQRLNAFLRSTLEFQYSIMNDAWPSDSFTLSVPD